MGRPTALILMGGDHVSPCLLTIVLQSLEEHMYTQKKIQRVVKMWSEITIIAKS